jgi:hypothetical protein
MIKDMKRDWQDCLDNKVGFKVNKRGPGCCGEKCLRLRNWVICSELAIGC